MKATLLLPVFLLCLSLGCDDGKPSGGTAPPPGAAAATPAGGGPPAPVPPPAPAIQEKASEDFTKKGIAGKELGKGILATPAGVYLRIPDRAIFLSVEHAMNLYKGEHGALPKTHEDFLRDIIQANNIKLPELPDDSHYIYMPEKEELMIERQPM